MVHCIFAVEGYADSIARFEKEFHHRPYKNGKFYSRVRKIQCFGIFEWYDFTIEEQALDEFMADMRCFFFNDLAPFWSRRRIQDKSEKLNFDESCGADNKKEHFKKYLAWRIFEALFYPLRFFGIPKPLHFRKSFVREHLEADGKVFLMQGFFIGLIQDRKHDGVEYI